MLSVSPHQMGMSPGHNVDKTVNFSFDSREGPCILTACRHQQLLVPQCITVEVGFVADLCRAHWLQLHVYDCLHLQSASSAFCTDVFEISHKTAHFQHIPLA